jgi:hypothetical protein
MIDVRVIAKYITHITHKTFKLLAPPLWQYLGFEILQSIHCVEAALIEEIGTVWDWGTFSMTFA